MSVQFVVDKDAEQPHDDAIWGVKWTTKDQVVSVGLDGALKVWDSQGALLHSPTPHPLGITSLSVSPLANRSLSNSIDGTTLLHSLSSGQLLGTHQSFLKPSNSTSTATASSWTVAMHPEEKVFASSGSGGKVVLREARVEGDEGFEQSQGEGWGAEKRVLETGKDKFGMDLKYSPDGRLLALSSDTGAIFIFDVEAGSLVATYATHSVCVRALSWSPDGQFLFSGSDDKSIILHDVRSSTHSSSSNTKISSGVSTLTGHTSWILSLATSPSDGRLLASTSADKTIKLWDVRAGGAGGQKGGCVGTFQEAEASWGVDWRPLECDQREVGKRFVSGGEEKVVRFWRAAGAA